MTVRPATRTRRERRLAERAARHDARRRRRGRRSLGLGALSVIAIVGGLVVVAIAMFLGARPIARTTEATSVTSARAPADLATDGFALGAADAPVTIDLYEDFQCPACESWGRNVFPTLAANELAAGSVRIVFHDMAFLGQESVAAGRAAYAARQQDRFWDMWATLYANQGHENSGAFNRDRLIAMAQELGLDADRFIADMDSPGAMAAIEASRGEARRAGVTSTPTLVIGGQMLAGVGSYPEIAGAISAVSVP
jgi:protein-disulfide isomerase